MKKLIITACIAVALTTTVNAQEAAKPQLSKEEKAKQKQKAEDDLNAAFKDAGVADDVAKQAKVLMDEAKAKRSEVKKSVITDDEKITKTKEINTDEKEKLIALLGGDKYKIFKDIQKKQKAAASTTNM